MTNSRPSRTAPCREEGTAESGSTSSHPTSSLPWLYGIRGLLAIIWAAAFATVCDSLTAGTATLAVLYPVIDVVASVVDSRSPHSKSERITLWFGAATSTLAAIVLAAAGTDDVADVLHVFGVWATVSGLTQIVVALRRRGPTTGGQWPMLIAGALSALVGVFYNLEARDADPQLNDLVTYAAAGGAFFIIQAAILLWRRHRRTSPHRATV
jgi:uncharacterized membrane protein HdeD (DUF308 family)